MGVMLGPGQRGFGARGGVSKGVGDPGWSFGGQSGVSWTSEPTHVSTSDKMGLYVGPDPTLCTPKSFIHEHIAILCLEENGLVDILIL